MQYVILAYRSRNQTAKMYEYFTKYNIPCKIINTPREANVGCGLSLKFDANLLDLARKVATKYPQTGYVGFFAVYFNGCSFIVKRVA